MALYPGANELLTPEERKLPVGAQRRILYARQLDKLRQECPNLIVVQGFEALAGYLNHHRWCREDVRKTIPCSADWFRHTIGREVPFILSTRTVRNVYPEMFEGMSLEACNARRLYDPKDVLDWLRENFISTVTSVLVPLGMMTKDPEGLREVFRQVSGEHLREAYTHRRGPNGTNPDMISSWPEIQDMISPEYRPHFGSFRDDLSRLMQEQGTTQRAYVKLPEVEVRLPDDKLPRFFSQKEVGLTRGYSSFGVSLMTIKFFAWAEHRLREPERFLVDKRGVPKSRSRPSFRTLLTPQPACEFSTKSLDIQPMPRLFLVRSGYDKGGWRDLERTGRAVSTPACGSASTSLAGRCCGRTS